MSSPYELGQTDAVSLLRQQAMSTSDVSLALVCSSFLDRAQPRHRADKPEMEAQNSSELKWLLAGKLAAGRAGWLGQARIASM